MKRWLVSVVVSALLVPGAIPATPRQESGQSSAKVADSWMVWGGIISFEWNRELFPDLGMELGKPDGALAKREGGRITDFMLRENSGLRFTTSKGNLSGFVDGSLAVRGGHDVRINGESLGLVHFSLQPRKHDPMGLDFVSSDGSRWLYVDRMLYQVDAVNPTLHVRSMDIRISKALAERLGDASLEGIVLGRMEMSSRVHGEGFNLGAKGVGCPTGSKWPGMPAPGGNTYQADVFMKAVQPQYMRRQNSDGPGGALDGDVMYTPSSTLKNNVNAGSSLTTVAGVAPSAALYAADVAWHTFFTGDCPPYDNDQHPFLIWNMYRAHVVPGSNPVQYSRIEQIGRSGVKHAYVTINSGPECDRPFGNVLGLGCEDVYGTGDNDSQERQGPRSEIVPALGLWGRCGSKHDPNCDGSQGDRIGYGSFDNRMTVKESQIDPALNPGVHYLFESWYIVRDDINIYNTMQTTRVTPSWNPSLGGSWPLSVPGPATQGPAIDRFLARGTNTATARSTDIVRPEGQGRVAVKVTDLGGGQFRYDYAVMNFDFAEAVLITDGSAGPDNVSLPNNPGQPKVVSNDGFVEFRVPLPAGSSVSLNEFSDGDTVSANDWTTSVASDAITWNGVAGNQLNWGTLFRFSFVVNVEPTAGTARLRTARADTPTFEDVQTLIPAGAPAPTFAVGGEVSGVAGSDGVDLQLNGGETITRTTDGVYAFTTELGDGASYSVAITREPTGSDCSIAQASGVIASADAVDVDVTCVAEPVTYAVGGTVTGIDVGQSVTLQLNGSETKDITAAGNFVFDTRLADDANYSVVVISTSPLLACAVSSGDGQVDGGDVADIAVSCETLPLDVFENGFEP